MSKTDKRAIKDFVDRWRKAEGNEQREANSFWIELAGLLGMSQPTRRLDFERKVHGRRIDVFYEDMGVLIENKSRGVDLDKAYERGRDEGGDKRMVTPYQQAKWYADNLPRSISPRWVLVCNFDEVRIHDLNLENPGSDYVSVRLEELPEQIHLLSFFNDSSQSRLVKEMELSVKAGEVVGSLYKALEGQYKNLESDEHEQRSLNVLVVRLVFLLYAEDAGLLQSHQAFGRYLKTIEARHMRQALMDLFKTLDTKVEDRDPYLDPELAEFPYINGGLFADEGIVIPQFTEDMKVDLVLNASIQFDWKDISPTIFGAVFESTLNPENLVRESLQVSSMVSERGLAMRVMNSVRFRAVVESISFEQTTQRFLIAYHPADKPNEREEIRSERVDSNRGQLVRMLWNQSLVGEEVVIFKNNEPDKTGKVAAGFRVAVWVLDNGKPRK